MSFCFLAQNFAEIGQSVHELWPGWKFATVHRISTKSDDFSLRYGDLTTFKMDFKNLQIFSHSPCRHAVLLPHTKFRWNRTIGRWVMAKKAPPSWISKISIFGYVTVTVFNIWYSVPNLIKIGRFLTEIWRFNDLQNGGRPQSWICYDVTVLHRRTHFRCPNIVLKFYVDRFCSFRDTCSIIV